MDSLARSPIDIFSRWIFHHGRLTSRLIPLETSRFFAMNACPLPNSSPIISLLQKKRLSYRFVFFPEVKTNEEAFNLLETLCNSNQRPDFLLVHFPELDPVTHEWGTKSSQTRNLVRKTDLMIAKATEMFSKDSYVITFSDHGMFDVRGCIDVATKINTLDCPRNDFVVFLDSIMARFWIFKNSTFEKIMQIFSEETSGAIIMPDKPQIIDKFGHIMFLCSPGYIISPNYYDSKPPTAMHGYAPSPQISPLNGIFLANNLPTTLPDEKLLMTDIASILKQTIEHL
jgi:predicted AlkP superfamily pyrophosphatase or phosphodiesterase